MKILFLGYAVNAQCAEHLSGASIAGNKMQLNILKNLVNEVNELKVLTILPFAPFPKDKILWSKHGYMHIEECIEAESIPFLNIPIVKQVFQIICLYVIACRYADQHTVVLTFNMFPQVGIPAVWLKKKFHCQVVSVLADLPVDDNYQRKGVARLLRKMFEKITCKNISEVDKLIVLNKTAREEYAPNTAYMVMEGGVNPEEFKKLSKRTKEFQKKKIVYSGSLAEYSGISELVEAMNFVINKEICLEIYGDGVLKEYIQKKALENPLIHYYGRISNKESLDIQSQAWLLVNPRPIDDPVARVTFPSKIFEYMMSGTPILSTKLNGFSKDYYDKMFFAEDNNPKELARWINYIDTIPTEKLEEKAELARQFVVESKNWKKQVHKMINFIRE